MSHAPKFRPKLVPVIHMWNAVAQLLDWGSEGCLFDPHRQRSQCPVSLSKTKTVKPVLSDHSKRRPKIVIQDRLSLNAGHKYCRMLQGEHSAILSTFSKLPFVIKIFVSSILSGCLRQVLLYLLLSTGSY